jgi:AAA family ATP:ADP antiporter
MPISGRMARPVGGLRGGDAVGAVGGHVRPRVQTHRFLGANHRNGCFLSISGRATPVRCGASKPGTPGASSVCSGSLDNNDHPRGVASIKVAFQHQIGKLDGLWSQLVPMTCLFFMLAFVNTIIDSLKDSLVITAVGGGTEVLPYLSTYAVLPSSIMFLILYSWMTRNMSREKIFNMVIGCFLMFYAGFALAYPHHEVMHGSDFADWLQGALPNGLAGFVGMIRNWMFTAFYCVSELWGDILLSLLFWGLANETTSIEDAPVLYPLFGIGANIAQTCAGRSLRLISEMSHSYLNYTQQVQLTVAICVAMGFAIVGVHTHIVRTFEKNPKGSAADRKRKLLLEKQSRNKRAAVDDHASVPGLNYCDMSTDKDKNLERNGDAKKGATEGMSIISAWKYLIKSPQIRCLAVMALAQGLTTRILEVSWKHYLHVLHPGPVAYAAFLGDTAMWTGVSTALMMVASPLLFDMMGWAGVASATPNIMLIGGIPFFIACVLYSFGGSALAAGMISLKGLVIGGALLHVFSRGAKFSLFKPSEEMVYIGLDDESRTKGKAAIDVVGAQSGKSIGSILQQFLLIFVTGGSVAGIIPVLGLCFVTMLGQWKRSIRDLADHGDPQHAHRASVMGSIDSDGEEGEPQVSTVSLST